MTDTPPSRRERRRQQQREAWLEVAMEAVEHHGLQGLSLHAVARERDQAVSAVYRYFASKGALIAGLQHKVVNEYEGAMDAFLASRKTEERALHRLKALALHYHAWMLHRPGRLALIAFALGSPQHVLPEAEATAVMAEVRRVLARIEDVISEAQQEGDLGEGDAEQWSLLTWSSIHGILLMRKLARFDPDRFDNPTLMEETINVLLRGWGAPQTTLQNGETQ